MAERKAYTRGRRYLLGLCATVGCATWSPSIEPREGSGLFLFNTAPHTYYSQEYNYVFRVAYCNGVPPTHGHAQITDLYELDFGTVQCRITTMYPGGLEMRQDRLGDADATDSGLNGGRS